MAAPDWAKAQGYTDDAWDQLAPNTKLFLTKEFGTSTTNTKPPYGSGFNPGDGPYQTTNPGQTYTNTDGLKYTIDEYGSPHLLPKWAQTGMNGANGSIDEQKLALATAKFAQQTGYDAAKIDAQLRGQDTKYEIARAGDLKSLIENRNNNSIGLVNAEGNIAKNAADFAAHPYDATADLMYRQAAGMNSEGGTPYGSIGNKSFGQLGGALGDKFQSIFGNLGGDLGMARTYVNAIPPKEYFPGGEYPTDTGSPTAPSAPAAPSADALQTVSNIAGQNNGTLPQSFYDYTHTTNPAVPGFSHGGTIADQAPQGGSHMVGATTSEGGTNMNVPEPAKIVGIKSGHVYATMSETDPEQLIIKPLPSVMKKRKEQEQKAADGKKALIAGAKRYDTGGSITYGKSPSDFMDQLRSSLGSLGANTPSGQALPDPRLLAGDQAYDQFSNDKDFGDLTRAGYSSLGITPNTLAYTVNKYRPQAYRRTPQVSFV